MIFKKQLIKFDIYNGDKNTSCVGYLIENEDLKFTISLIPESRIIFTEFHTGMLLIDVQLESNAIINAYTPDQVENFFIGVYLKHLKPVVKKEENLKLIKNLIEEKEWINKEPIFIGRIYEVAEGK